MKSLKESIFDNIDDIVSNDPLIHKTIEQFLRDNYKIAGSYTIKNGVVDVNGSVYVKQRNISNPLISLVNKLFRFGNVSGSFDCCFQTKLASLEGAPEKVGGSFSCNWCESLTSLEGAPENVSGSFSCSYCEKLTSLKGAPEEVDEGFYCINCEKITSLEGAPKETPLICCHGCKNLKFTDQDRKNIKLKNINDIY